MMKRINIVLHYVLLLFSLFGCTMDISQPASATPVSEVLSASPTPAATAGTNTAQSPSQTIPITWANLNLNGRLVYNTVSQDSSGIFSPRIQMLDLATGEIDTIYTGEGGSWIYYLSVSPDAKQLLMSYLPPVPPGGESNTSLNILSLDQALPPQTLFTPPTPDDRYIQVEWAPDGKYIYLVHYNHKDQPADEPFPSYDISRMAYSGGQPEKILEHAFWPRVSADSSRLVYVTLDPVSGLNKLFFAVADGFNSQEIMISGLPAEIIDAPIFAPDGQSILFSAPTPAQAYQPNWLDRLMGIHVAKAHNVPSDWWSVPISGGMVNRLTQIQTIKLFASISPDHNHIASVSGEGIFVMNADGSNLQQLVFDPGVTGVVNWIP
jgi:Tol biopolymer transport system component